MATIKFMLQSKKEKAPIYLRLTLGRNKDIFRRTGLVINPKDWSTKTRLPKQSKTPQNKNITSRLRKLETFVIDKLNDANSNAEVITGDWLFHQIELFFNRISENNKSELVIDAIQKIIDEAPFRDNGKGGIGLTRCRVNSYKRLKTLFIDFQNKNQYKIKELDRNKFDNFRKWLLDKNGYSASYSLKKLSDLKTVCKDARSNGIETSTELNDIKTKQVSAYDDDMDVIILTPQELEQIENTNLTSKALINARKWLILACYTGQRGKALTTRIKDDNFEKYGADLVIKIRQKKGNKPVIIPVLPKVKEIYQNGFPIQYQCQN